MPSDLQPRNTTSRAKALVALIIVALTVIAVWKFIEYHTEPPEPPTITAPP
jgi:hypothetical protein